MPIITCVVDGCQSNIFNNVLYNFPRAQDQRRIWLDILTPHAVRLRGKMPSDVLSQKVCFSHFESQYFRFGGTKPKKLHMAFPTLFTNEEILSGRPAAVFKINDVQLTEEHNYFKPISDDVQLTEEHNYFKPISGHDHTYSCTSKNSLKLELTEKTGSADEEFWDSFPVHITLPRSNPSLEQEPAQKTINTVTDEEFWESYEKGTLPPSDPSPEQEPEPDTPPNEEDVNSGITGITLDEIDEPPIEAIFSWQKDEIIYPTEDTDELMCPGQDISEELTQDLGDVSLYDDPTAEKNPDSDKHAEYQCNVCEKEIKGFRYTCVQCADWDLCGACEARAAHAAHYVLRVPRTRPYNEIQAVLAAIRHQLLSENLFLSEQITEDSVKAEEEEPRDAEAEPRGAEAEEEPAPAPDPLQPLLDSEDEHTDGSEYRPRRKRRRRSSDTSDSSQAESQPDSDIQDAQDVKTTCGHDNLDSDERVLSESPKFHHVIDHSRRKPFTRSASIHPINHINVDTDTEVLDYYTEEVLHSSSQQPIISRSRQQTNHQSVLKLAGTIYEVSADTIRDADAILEIPDNVTVLIQETPNIPHISDSFDINPLDIGKEADVGSNLEDASEILHTRVPPDTNEAALASGVTFTSARRNAAACD